MRKDTARAFTARLRANATLVAAVGGDPTRIVWGWQNGQEAYPVISVLNIDSRPVSGSATDYYQQDEVQISIMDTDLARANQLAGLVEEAVSGIWTDANGSYAVHSLDIGHEQVTADLAYKAVRFMSITT